MSRETEIASELAQQAGLLIAQAAARDKAVEFKGDVDLVTATDRAAQNLIVAGLERAFPGDAIVAEEDAQHQRASGRVWYIDPLDGTANFVHNLGHSSVSIALLDDSGPLGAVVHDPFRGELFEAARGQGTRCNGKATHCSTTQSLDQAMLVSGFPYDRREHCEFYLRWFRTFLERSRDVRRFGSAALDLAWVAAGRFDGFWEWRLKPWDTAAGWLLVVEAGGLVSDFDGAPYDAWAPRILASNGPLHPQMLAVLEELGGASEPPGAS